jgi:hypothetical protein
MIGTARVEKPSGRGASSHAQRPESARRKPGSSGTAAQSNCNHAHTQRLAEHQQVAGLRIGIALDALRVHQTQRHQAVDGLHRIDGVATGDRDAGAAAHHGAALQDLADGGDGQHVDRYAHPRQRQDRPAAHRIDIAEGVGGGVAAEVEGVRRRSAQESRW